MEEPASQEQKAQLRGWWWSGTAVVFVHYCITSLSIVSSTARVYC